MSLTMILLVGKYIYHTTQMEDPNY